MDELHRPHLSAAELHDQIDVLVKLIEQTEHADPMDPETVADRCLYRACLDWRMDALLDQLH